MYLIDTNILLEIILNQEQCLIAEELLNRDDIRFYLSDFSLYSIGIFLIRRKDFTAWIEILKDIKTRGISIVRLQPDELAVVSENCYSMNLDFDDGYQYTIAEKYHLHLVSFDHHFDKTTLGRIHPQNLLKS